MNRQPFDTTMKDQMSNANSFRKTTAATYICTKVQTTDSWTSLGIVFEVKERERTGGRKAGNRKVTETGEGYTKETLEASERMPRTRSTNVCRKKWKQVRKESHNSIKTWHLFQASTLALFSLSPHMWCIQRTGGKERRQERQIRSPEVQKHARNMAPARSPGPEA